jgi:hypothetical protein
LFGVQPKGSFDQTYSGADGAVWHWTIVAAGPDAGADIDKPSGKG